MGHPVRTIPAPSSYDGNPQADIPEHSGEIGPYGPCKHCGGCLQYCRQEPFPDEDAFYCLIEKMVMEIHSLEEEIVRTHQVLAEYLPKRWADGLRQDIFCGLSARFAGIAPYDRYVEYCHSGTDPMETEEQVARMLRLRDGVDETTYYHLLPRNNRKR